MPERQHSPGEVDADHAGTDAGSGATTATGAGEVSSRRTDSPRGDALFSPARSAPPEQVTAPTRAEGRATAAVPASGAPKKPSPAPRTDGADSTDTVDTTATESLGAGVAKAGAAPAAGGPAQGAATPPQGVSSATAGHTAPTDAPGAPDGATDGAAATAAPAQAGGTSGHGAGDAAGSAAATVATRSVAPTNGTPAHGTPAHGTPAHGTPAPTTPPAGTSAPAAAAASTAAASTAAASTAAAAEATPGASGDAPTDAPADTGATPAAPTGPTGTPAQGTPVFDEEDRSTAVHAAVAPATSPGTSGEDTQIIPRASGPAAEQPTRPTGPADPPTEQIPVTRGGVPPVPPQQRPAPTGEGDAPGGGRKKPLLIVAGVVALLAVLYVADLVLSTGNVPRGVTVAGMQLGGLSKAEASERLRTAIEPRATQPVQVTAGEVESRIDPVAAGLQVDYQATIEQAGEQPLNPITRITSFFTQREVGVVNKADERSVLTALEQVKPVVDKAPVEGTVRFEGTTPIAVAPVPGQELDLQAAVGVLESEWASGAPVALPLIPQATITTDEDVQQALQSVATPAVSAPVTIQGEGATATLRPADIASALSFRADAAADPKLVPEINNEALKEVATPQLASSETPGRDAALDFSTGAPVVVPSQDGRGVDYDKTFEGLVGALTAQGPRTLTAVYADQPAKLTTEQLGALGITGEISSFTTGGFAADSGRNIRRAAEQINGTIVQPGETFSLNKLTNPRNAANGYVEAGIIENGHSARGIGGGVSQVATTLYNAAYFAGMVDVEHKEHSFYISRYPAAREATVFDDIIDLKFRNDGPTGVFIQTIWTPQNLTVKMFGTKRYEVTSATGPRTNPTEPQTLTLPAGPGCVPGRGSQGFTTTDTRTMRNLETGEVTSKTRTVKYNPVPTVVCQ
ncbi:VanW family protein [Pseudonocardia oroxyli]|uniref:Vancomycin resistance protein YoaR, contains peptidoglycan-binding and VanW domains n=1 Tax=Pseudonocardia oroxyli TaxID=366584 RepID=A0A1G7LH34_PSEOR|nr:VanW family protein [Pseudonocardia oroxyli]SDF48279.1 Vancomycin resistance protein YoaR, contains peptidoglycan-binding and VanW domains [Pseudonocardia oroxyli]